MALEDNMHFGESYGARRMCLGSLIPDFEKHPEDNTVYVAVRQRNRLYAAGAKSNNNFNIWLYSGRYAPKEIRVVKEADSEELGMNYENFLEMLIVDG